MEFVAQSLQLVAADRSVRDPCTRRALTRLGKAGLLTPDDTALLLEADAVWRRLQCLLRLLCGPVPPLDLERELAPPTLAVLLHAMEMESVVTLLTRTTALARNVRACFARVVGPVAEGDAFAEVMVEANLPHSHT